MYTLLFISFTRKRNRESFFLLFLYFFTQALFFFFAVGYLFVGNSNKSLSLKIETAQQKHQSTHKMNTFHCFFLSLSGSITILILLHSL